MACDGIGDHNFAFGEVVKVVGRELQKSKERIRQLEDALEKSRSRSASASVNSEAGAELLERAVSAEAREVILKKELEDARIKMAKQNVRIENLEKQVVKLQSVKQEEEVVVLQHSKTRKQLRVSQEDREKQQLKMSRLESQLDTMKVLQQEVNEEEDQVALLHENVQFLHLEEKLCRTTAENEALSANTSRLELDVFSLTLQIKEKEGERKEMWAQLRKFQHLEMPWPVEMYATFCDSGRPPIQNRPDYGSLKPICLADENRLKKLFEMDKSLNWVTDRYICLPLPELLVWTSETCQVGLAFSPMSVFTGPYWRECSLSKHSGPLEVFFSDRDNIYYAGSYTKESMRERNPQGCARGSMMEAARLLSERAFVPLTYAEFDHYSIETLLESLYSEGVLRAECTILRCVGFNHYIHNSLSGKYDGAQALQNRITQYRRQEGSGYKRRRFEMNGPD